jgi:hypothetical protein
LSTLKPDPTKGVSSQLKSVPSISTSGMPGMIAGRRGVPLSVPLPFLLTGASAAALFGILLPWIAPEAVLAPDFPHVLALVHLATLGWLTMIIMGASLQLTPVITVSPLRATHLLRWQYPVYVSGVTLLLCGFWWMQPWLMATGGSLVVLAVVHYTVILGTSLVRAATRPLTVPFLAASVIALCIVVSLGLTMAINLQFGFLGAAMQQILLVHLVLGILGWLSNTLIGVSYTLTRMFALAHGHSDRLGRIVFVLLNGSIVVLVPGFTFGWFPLIAMGGGALVMATWLFAYDFLRILHARRRRVLDVTQYHSIAAVVYFSLVTPAGIAAALAGWQQPTTLMALGLAALVGWLGQSTVGYLYKIVPFLVWQSRYGSLVGRQKVPLMREMLHERWAWGSWWLINIGLACALFSALFAWVLPLQIASGLLGVGFVLAAINIFGVVRHLSMHKKG